MNASSDAPSREQLLDQLRKQLGDPDRAREALRSFLTSSAGRDLGWLLVRVDDALARLDQDEPATVVLDLCEDVFSYNQHIGSLRLNSDQKAHVEQVEEGAVGRRRQLHASLAQIRRARQVSATWAISPPDPEDPPAISADEVALAEQLIEKTLAWLRYDELYNEPGVGLHVLYRKQPRQTGRPSNEWRNLLETLLGDVLQGAGIKRAGAARLILGLMKLHRAELDAAGIPLPLSAKSIEQRLMGRERRKRDPAGE